LFELNQENIFLNLLEEWNPISLKVKAAGIRVYLIFELKQ